MCIRDRSWRNRGEESLDVRVSYAVGRFEVGPISGDLLYTIKSRYDAEVFDLYSAYRKRDGRGRLRIDIEGEADIEFSRLKDYDARAGHLELGITDAIPVSISVELGAAEALLDLGGIRLSGLKLETGASDTKIRFGKKNSEAIDRCVIRAGAATIEIESLGNSGCRHIEVEGGIGAITLDFSGDWDYNATAEIKVGLGAVEVRVPSELGVRIERKTFLMSLDAPDFWKGDDAWVSRNWSEASTRLELNLSGALGTINIVRI